MEDAFLKDNIETGRINCICATQGAGKTYFAISYIKFSIDNELYDKIYFICPTLYKEHDKQYDFMNNQQSITLYETYNDKIIDEIEKEVVNNKILLICDDASAYLMKNKHSNELYKLSTCVRHGMGCTVFLLVHSLISVIYPTVRSLINYLFIGNFGNVKLIKSIHEEYLSLYMDFNDFKNEYLEIMEQVSQNLILIDCKHFKIDWITKKWNMLKYHDYELQPDGKAINGKKYTKIDEMKDSLKLQKTKNELREVIIPKKKKNNFFNIKYIR